MELLTNEIGQIGEEKQNLIQSIAKIQISIEAEEKLLAITNGEIEELITSQNRLIQQLRQTQVQRTRINQELHLITATTWEVCEKNLNTIRNKALEHRLLDNEIQALNRKIERLQRELERLDRNIQEQIEQKKIISMTIDKYISLFMDVPLRCSHIFVDEAGFAALAKAICLFNSGTPVTFIGDHKQIPPICENRQNQLTDQTVLLWSSPAMFAPWLIQVEHPLNDLTFPEIDQLYPHMYTLTTSYRFGKNLAHLLDLMMYRCNLNSLAIEPLKIRIKHISGGPAPEKRVNIEEARLARDCLFEAGNSSAAIITPYKRQVSRIKQGLPQQLRDQVFTIHKAQGREWDTVIFSVVDDGTPQRNLFFTDFTNTNNDADKLINTALSRAKKELIIVCNRNYWENRHDADQQLISRIISIANPS